MARPLRIEYPGAVYHITSRGNAREAIALADDDRDDFFHVLGTVVERHSWRCYAYCLMTNHYHLLVETPTANLSRGMRQMNGLGGRGQVLLCHFPSDSIRRWPGLFASSTRAPSTTSRRGGTRVRPSHWPTTTARTSSRSWGGCRAVLLELLRLLPDDEPLPPVDRDPDGQPLARH